ncbi:MAG TPA: glycosyltransferase [Anaerolineales bacterium]|nr:glycosyltransferase [Anaerolineales bacterium]HLO30383.1 glycosyltransferase [Anaerolineales bacterium]
MSEQSLRILQVSTYDTIGGAEKVAWNLFQAYRERGYGSWLAVGHKLGGDPDVFPIPNDKQRGSWSRFWMNKYSNLESTTRQPNGESRLRSLFKVLAEPGRAIDHYRGIEDFRFPGTGELLKLTPYSPDILHCHNLHGSYFDLRALPWLSRQVPLILTLHDAWLLSGHCAHSFGCERWKIGCGHCPDLRIEPPVVRDATAYNWKRKRTIYEQSQIYVSTPSQWLMKKTEQSILAPAIVESRVIPNGVDLTIFHPSDKSRIRSLLNIPQEAAVLLFAAYNVRNNIWKDYQTLRTAIDLVGKQLEGRETLFIALGEDAPPERIGQAELRLIPYQKDSAMVACYYQAADLYVHAAKADTFPNTILESLACGTPVVATAVGGIPEQIMDALTGRLTPAGDAQALASRILELLSDDMCRKNMSIAAAEDARLRFNLQSQVDTYLEWYQMLVQKEQHALPLSERLTASAYR